MNAERGRHSGSNADQSRTLPTCWQGAYAVSWQHLDTCPSTNTWAIEHASQFSESQLPLLVTTDLQTGGRGRSGRQWYADQGTLTFSVLDDAGRMGLPRQLLPRLALVAGLAVSEAIDQWIPPLTTRLKWPNDLYIDGGKVGGVLVESVGNGERVVIGIGVNVATDLSLAADEVRQRARALVAVAGRPLQRYELLELILERIEDHLSAIRVSGQDAGAGRTPDQVFAQVVHEMRPRCLLTGHQVTLQQGSRILQGSCLGIDDQGALILRINGTIEHIQSGEIIRRI